MLSSCRLLYWEPAWLVLARQISPRAPEVWPAASGAPEERRGPAAELPRSGASRVPGARRALAVEEPPSGASRPPGLGSSRQAMALEAWPPLLEWQALEWAGLFVAAEPDRRADWAAPLSAAAPR